MTSERYSRQQNIVPADKLAKCKITVIGVGAIGRQVALQLAAMGAPELQIVDFDMVEEANLGAQGFLESDLGKPKVTAVKDLVRAINSNTKISTEQGPFTIMMSHGNVVFCCVDQIDTRSFIWQHLSKDKELKLFIDGRMSAEVLRVLAAHDAKTKKHYKETLFAPSEAFRGACTAKTTIYCANIAAGWMIAQFTKWLRGMEPEVDTTVNIFANEIVSSGGKSNSSWKQD